jgi:hypothetical protein
MGPRRWGEKINLSPFFFPDFEEGEVTMFMMDMPDVPPQYTQVMLVQASQSQQTKAQYERTIGVCQLINNPPNAPKEPWAGSSATSPAAAVALYYQNIEGRVFDYEGARVSVIESPKHGNLQAMDDGAYYYFPETGYLGKDRVTFLVEIGGSKFKVAHYLQMMEIVPEYAHEDRQYCPKGIVWKISATLNPDGSNTLTSVEYQSPTIDAEATTTDTAALAATLGTGILTSLAVDTSGITLNIANLEGGAVGQAVGNAITLDDNAAGHQN